MRKEIKIILVILVLIIGMIFSFFFVGKTKPAKDITFGVVFSKKQAELLGLDWKKNYLALLDDLKVKDLKLIAYWDLIEKEPGVYDFSDLDWQIEEAEKRGAKVLLVIGYRVPRWPECHIPAWLEIQNSKFKNQNLLKYLENVVNHYKNSRAIWAWQVENEPFFPFGKCPPFREELLKKEINLVKLLDELKRPVVISESGEFPLWFKVAKFGDIVGHTLYRKAWFPQLKIYFTYPFPPIFYARKAWLVRKLFQKEVICIELQAEPWGQVLLNELPLKEQEKTMNLEIFKKNIEFARKTGIEKFYLWGGEWWYWLKEKKNNDKIWEEAKKLWKN